jgi:E3 ubiquitin-protein ligase UBR1
LTSTDSEALYSAAQIIGSIDLAVTVRPAQVSFCEDVAGVFIEFLLDICSARYADDPNAFARTVAHILLAPLPRDKPAERPSEPQTRFEQLLAFDIRLWKQARLQLRELYVRLLLVGSDVRAEIGAPARCMPARLL